MYDQEKLNEFQTKNGMTLEIAWSKVCEWNLAGNKEAARQGCEEIVKIFPDHEASKLLNELNNNSPNKVANKVEAAGEKMVDSIKDGFEKVKENYKNSKNPELQEEKKQKEAEYEEDLKTAQEKDLEENENLFAALSYISILFIIPLLFKKDSKFAQFHGKQGLVLFAILYFFKGLILAPFIWIFSRSVLVQLVKFIVVFFSIILMIVLAVMAWRGVWFKIPGVYNLSRKIP